MEQRFGQLKSCHSMASDVVTKLPIAETNAFKRQEGQVVARVDSAQGCVEFEAVYDARRRTDPDVLRAQVSMSVDDATGTGTLGQQLAMSFEKPAVGVGEVTHRRGRQAAAPIGKRGAVFGSDSSPVRQQPGWRNPNR
jgi:hypothetical protein